MSQGTVGRTFLLLLCWACANWAADGGTETSTEIGSIRECGSRESQLIKREVNARSPIMGLKVKFPARIARFPHLDQEATIAKQTPVLQKLFVGSLFSFTCTSYGSTLLFVLCMAFNGGTNNMVHRIGLQNFQETLDVWWHDRNPRVLRTGVQLGFGQASRHVSVA